MLKWSKFAFNLLSTFFKCRFNRSWMILRLVFAIAMLVPVYSDFAVDCSNLQIGQYSCDLPIMDLATQQPFNCMPNDTASVNCTLIEGLQCTDTGSSNFTRPIRCDYTNGYSFETALLLAIFLGLSISTFNQVQNQTIYKNFFFFFLFN